MLFQTWTFGAFFVVFYVVYLAVKHTRAGHLWILVASYFFYAWWDPWYVALIAYATLFDYVMLALMERLGRRKLWPALSIISNLGLLGFFKYAGFAAENVNYLLSVCGASYTVPMPTALLPVGLSFYIFKSIAYVLDCYRGAVERERNLIRHAVFVSFFPILLAGPIERAGNLLSQLKKLPGICRQDICDGLCLFIVGLFKKVALADYLSQYVAGVYESPADHKAPALILATFAFGWQIYFDFSGYTDMARGIGRMMGFKLMLNFNNPYLATGLGDFWRRWHISLSSWFRDYVYIPLGGNRGGTFNTYRNMFVTMLISGLWHGAAWTFVIWGAVHGTGMALTRALERSRFYNEKVPRFVKQICTFLLVTFGWIFFRASSWDDARLIVTRIFSSGLSDARMPVLMLLLVFLVWIYQFLYESRFSAVLKPAFVRVGLVVAMVLYLAVFSSSTGQAFIYLQF